MKLVAYYAVFNEAEYIEYSLRSIYDYVDQIIIIEGAWAECYLSSGSKRSNDGTLEIIQKFPDPQKKIRIFYHNEDSQLHQRNRVFDYLPLEKNIAMLLVDGDEIYDKKDIQLIKIVADNKPKNTRVVRFKSLIFVNDFYTHYNVEYPRLFFLDMTEGSEKNTAKYKHAFHEPNAITEDGRPLESHTMDMPEIRFFHYSYCKSSQRFLEKKKERTRIHGEFSWELQDGFVRKKGVELKDFDEQHPEIMKGHPRFSLRAPAEAREPEVILFVEHSGIGNLVLATPMLKAIRKIKPASHIYVHAWERSARILEGAPFIDIIHTMHPNLLLGSIKRKINHLIISPLGAIDSAVDLFCAQADKVYDMNISPPWGKHEAEYKMDFARKLGYVGETPSCEVCIFPDNINNISGYLQGKKIGKFFCVNASFLKTDHWHMKHWGNTKYTKVLIELHKMYPSHHFIFVGTKQDRGDVDRIIANMSPTRCQERDKYQKYDPRDGADLDLHLGDVPEHLTINACGDFGDIKDCAALIAKSELCFGNDGGLMHIAAAIGVPTVTIFTFTNPIKNRPLSQNSLLAMKPCDKRIWCQHNKWGQCEENGCLDVSIDSALTKIKEAISGKSRNGSVPQTL